jgi:hypothetical protein
LGSGVVGVDTAPNAGDHEVVQAPRPRLSDGFSSVGTIGARLVNDSTRWPPTATKSVPMF